jgi:hypothetical protein
MTFLNPLVLFGLLAASIPIIIHLLNLRKLKVIEFSTLQFLKEMQKNKMRKIKLKQLILLALRVAAIAFLVLAFSRPAIKSVSLAGFGSQVKSTVIILFDNTLSMSLSDKGGEYFQQAKRVGKEILNLTQEGDEIYFLKFSELNPAAQFYSPISKSLVEKSIDETEISYISNDYETSLISASRILGATKNFSKEIYIISDLQKNNLKDNPTVLSKLIDKNSNVYFINIGENKHINYSVDSIGTNDKIFEANRAVNFSAAITNHSLSKADNLSASIYFRNLKVAQKGIDVSSKETRFAEFSGRSEKPGHIDVKVEIEDDDLPQDNVRYSSFYIPEKIKILLASDSPAEAIFLKLALEQTIGDESSSRVNITQTASSLINSQNFNNFDVIILNGINKLHDNSKLKAYIEGGGRLIIFPSENTDPVSFNRFSSEFGFTDMQGVSGSVISKDSYSKFGSIDFAHPVMQNIFQDRSAAKVESPKIFYSFNYKAGSKDKSIIDLQNGYSFLIEHDYRLGKIFLSASALSPAWNDFALKGIFVPLINRLVLYATSTENITENYTVGKNFSISFNRKIGKQVKLVFPDGREKILETIYKGNNTLIESDALDIPGNYFLYDNLEILRILSVNINPRESNTEKGNNKDFTGFLTKIAPDARTKIFNASDNITESITQERFGTELWKLFLILALLCLAAEMTIARTSKSQIMTTNE